MKSFIIKLKKKTIGWWASVATILALIIALVAWIWPEPLSAIFAPAPEQPSLAETLGITEVIPEKSPGKIRILVAKFDEVNQPSFRVTDLILANLKSALSTYPDTEIISTNRIITEQDGSKTAQKIGEIYGASIVIWGWQGLTDNAVPLGVHFDVVPSSEAFKPGTCAASLSQIHKASPTELSDLTLQTTVSNELSYVTLFTLGIVRFEADDWSNAADIFTDAISHLDENTMISAKMSDAGTLVNTDLLYYNRAAAYFLSGNPIKSLADLEKIDESKKTNSLYQFNLGNVYGAKGDYQSAIQNFTSVIDKNSSSELTALALLLRGQAREAISMFNEANTDYNSALKLDENIVLTFIYDTPKATTPTNLISRESKIIDNNPSNSLAYFIRAEAYENLGQINDALNDYNKAVELSPDFLAARQSRVFIKVENEIDHKDPRASIQDLDFLLKHDEYHTPCNLQNLARQYEIIGDVEKSKEYLRQVISLTTSEIQSNNKNSYTYYVRGIANYSLKQYIQAYQDFQKAKQLDPKKADKLNIGQLINQITEYYAQLTISTFVLLIILTVIIKVGYSTVKKKLAYYRQHHKSRSRHHANRP